MSKVKELYIALRDDPDLDIPNGLTREDVARTEAEQRDLQIQGVREVLEAFLN